MVLRRLLLANFAAHRIRVVLTVAAIALSVSLVVAVTAGYTSAEAAAKEYLSQFMGTTDVEIIRRDDANSGFDQGIADQLRHDPAVKSASGRLQMRIPLVDQQGNHLPQGGIATVIGIQRPDDQSVLAMHLEQGAWFDAATGNVAVVDQIAAEKLNVKVGDDFKLPSTHGTLSLRVVGIVHKPMVFAMAIQTIYVPLETLQQFEGRVAQINRLNITLHVPAEADAFRARWEPKLDPRLKLRTAHDARQDMENDLRGVHLLCYLGGAVSMVAALFIVFSALSMGVTERSRSLAMLRAIGAFRRQLAQLVVYEGLLLAILGCSAGVLMGWGWMKALTLWKRDIFTAGVVMSWGGVAFGAGGSLLAALLASFLPAWSAMRVSPLEAMSPLAPTHSNRRPLLCAIPGLLLLGVDPLLILTHLASPSVKFIGHFILGLPTEMVGFFLLAPLYVWLIEKFLAPPIALLLRVRPALLRQQLSGGIWRAAGTACALMVGLAILIVMQTQGHSMVSGWELPDKFPDVFIIAPSGLSWDQIKVLDDVKGLKKGQVMPIAIARPGMPGSPFASLEALALPDATLFLGVDPDQFLEMMELKFRDEQGRPVTDTEQTRLAHQAAAALKLGRHVIITNELRQLQGLKLGDKIPLMTVHGKVDYTICGIVWSPGIDAMVTMFDMEEQFAQRTVSCMFGSLKDAASDFGVNDVEFFAANVDVGVAKEELAKTMTTEMERQATVAAASRPTVGLDARLLVGLRNMFGQMGLRVADVRQVKYNMQHGLERFLLVLSSVAFASLVVAALGVANTIMASIRSRRWQFGILRSIGVTRSQLLRLVLAEALLLGLTGVALGVTCGAEMTLDANGLSRALLGYVVDLQVPWRIIWIGVAAVMTVSLAATLWPATSVALEEPLSLLQSGRAAA